MAAPRTADDKFLALLGRMPAPMETSDIAEALGWSRQNVVLVSSRLVREGKVVRACGESERSGRPPTCFSLPGAVPLPGAQKHAPLLPDTYVVTPSGEEARVIGMRGRSFAEFEYVTGPERFQRGTLHISLLRPFQPGRERPEPVRISKVAA
jgi:hypothetical protein